MSGSYFLLHHAQRKLISSKIEDDQLFLEEHNRPFDYDHIVPNSWLRGAPKILSELGNDLGNKRVLPFSENRSRGNESPAETFKNGADALELSSCSKGWLKVTDESLRTLQKKLILERMANIVQSWSDEYAIEKLISIKPDSADILPFFENMLAPQYRKISKRYYSNVSFLLKDLGENTGLYFYMYADDEFPTSADGVSFGLWIRKNGERVGFSKNYEIRLSELRAMRTKALKKLPVSLPDFISEDNSMYTDCKYTIPSIDKASKTKMISDMKAYLAAYGWKDQYFVDV